METNGYLLLKHLIEENNVFQLMLFNNDSIEIKFNDGAQLELSPCGANYQYIFPYCATLPKPARKFHQRCKFATSKTRLKVEAALKLRNLLAARPYIPSTFATLYQEKVDLDYRDIDAFQWETPSDPSTSIMSNISLESMDGLATYNVVQGIGMVKFMSKLSRNARADQQREQDADETCAVYKRKQHRREYVWLQSVFPVDSPSSAWRNLVTIPSKNVTTPAPSPLPEVCPNQFKHEWRRCESTSEDDEAGVTEIPNKALRMLCHGSTVYWFYPNDKSGTTETTPQNGYRVVVWLEDGSTIRTHPTNLFYLCHSQHDIPSTERTYSPTHLPHDPKLKNVILKVTRLLSSCLNCNNVKPEQCWATQIQPHECSKCSDIFETTTIADLGRFSVADGSIQIRFDSGITLHSSIDDQTFHRILCHGMRALCTMSCRLFYPDGQYTVCNNIVDHPQSLSQYIQPLCDWIIWLSQTKESRNSTPFYSDTIFAETNRNKVQNELEKIARFNVLLENSELKDMVEVSGNSSHEYLSLDCSSRDGGRELEDSVEHKENIYMELTGRRPRALNGDKVTADDVLVTLSRNTNTLNDIDEFLRNIALNK